MRRLLALICSLLSLAAPAEDSSPANEPDAPLEPPRCAGPEFAQLDFWLGEWDVVFEGGMGVNRITKVLDGCVVQEDFEGGPATNNLIGHSVSIFDRGTGQWRQTWVDNQGGYYALVGGAVGEKFVLTNSRLREDAPYLRMVFEDIQRDSLTWRWQHSTDTGKTWTDRWVITYRRRKS